MATGQNQDVIQVQQQIQRLQKARDKAEELSREKSRLTGEQGALQNQLKELETKCKKDFDCTIDDLPGFISQLKSEAETAIINVEVILGLREGTVTPSAPVASPTPMSAPKAAVKAARVVQAAGDDDGIP